MKLSSHTKRRLKPEPPVGFKKGRRGDKRNGSARTGEALTVRRIKLFYLFFSHGLEGPKHTLEVNESPNGLKVNMNQLSAAVLPSNCRCRFIFPDLFGICARSGTRFSRLKRSVFVFFVAAATESISGKARMALAALSPRRTI